MSPITPDVDSILEAIQTATDTERGVFFMSGGGVATFHDRHYRLIEQAVSTATLDETDYITPVLGLDDSLLANEVAVAVEGSEFVATDPDSMTEFGPATLSVAIYPNDVNEGLDHANYLLGLFSDPTLRLAALEFEIDPTRPVATLLGGELGNRYTITAPLAGDDLNMDTYLERVTHTIDLSHRWSISWQLSPAGATAGDFWLMGVVGFSEAGVSTVFGY